MAPPGCGGSRSRGPRSRSDSRTKNASLAAIHATARYLRRPDRRSDSRKSWPSGRRPWGRGLGPGRRPSPANTVAPDSPPRRTAMPCESRNGLISLRKTRGFLQTSVVRKKNEDPGQLPLTVAGGTLFCPLARNEARHGGPRSCEDGLKKVHGTGRENSFEILVRFRLTKVRRLPNLRHVRSVTGRNRDGLAP